VDIAFIGTPLSLGNLNKHLGLIFTRVNNIIILAENFSLQQANIFLSKNELDFVS
jgi:hypothetical protein